MRYPFYRYKKLFCLNKCLFFCKLSLTKESSEIIFNFPVSFSVLFLFVLPPILIIWAAFIFVFAALFDEHLWVGRFLVCFVGAFTIHQ